MKRIAALATLLAFVPLAGAELYKYTDKNGRTVYSDQPPAGIDSKQISSSGNVAPPPKTAVEKDKELEKGRKETRDKQDKTEKTAAAAKAQEERCQAAKEAVATYETGGRVFHLNDKGEREYMSEEDIAAALKRAQRDMEEACKKS